ncbi:hypothetical protein K6119_02190 [Paracrocinitomix mangrovi]|uniref:hypothetical protein n=1 Tax=Paracrocinitomix mangrovi TaxID=2862509 RepID=UPI001C8D180E|nr:hypothetical protein [Paracrocinitomix mangrovi]UKN02329.1 hypothetical protein K6119_02190 [Paracrocinitomix mangrovi]
MNTKIILTLMAAFIGNAFVSSAQEAETKIHPRITETKVDGEEGKKTYHLPKNTTYTLFREHEKEKLMQGEAATVDISSLSPGVYLMLYKVEEKHSILDRFTIE